MLTILVPMAGNGKRFQEAGYTLPKPLIDVNGKPMIERVIDNLDPGAGADVRWVFVVRDGDKELSRVLWDYRPGSYIIPCRPTEGAACTCMLARHRVPDGEKLLIANCDQLIAANGGSSVKDVGSDADVMTMEKHDDPRWSYIRLLGGTDEGRIARIAEKQPISNRATCGLYWFRHAVDFFEAAASMIAADDRVNGEFYVAPVMNYLIRDGKFVREIRIEDFGGVFWGLGTPEDLTIYLNRDNI